MKDREQYRSEKETGGDIVIKSPFVRWLDNFWYHYKWTVIIVAFFVVTFLICFIQCSTQRPADAYIAFAGAAAPTEEESLAVNRVLSLLMKEEDAPVLALRTHTYFTEEELRALFTEYYTEDELRALHPTASEEELKELIKEPKNFDNAGFNSAKQANRDRYSSLSNYSKTGECSLWFVSPAVFEQMGMKTIATPLSEIFGEQIPDTAANAYAIALSETALYQTYEALQIFPEDTLLVLTYPMVWGASSDKAQYEEIKNLYLAIVNFEAP